MSNLCLECIHCVFDMGSEGWSDMTPGDPATLWCRKNRFEQMFDCSDVKKFTETIRTAERCADFIADSPAVRRMV